MPLENINKETGLSWLMKNYKVDIEGFKDIDCLFKNDDYFDCYISASISLPEAQQIDRYINSRVKKGDLEKRTEHIYDKEINSSEGDKGSFVIMDRIIDGQISLQVVIPGETVKRIHDDTSINEEEKKKKIKEILKNFVNMELKPELESLSSIIQEQTQSNADTTR